MKSLFIKLLKIKAWIVSQTCTSQTIWSCCAQWNTQEYHQSRTSTPPSKNPQDRNVSIPTFLPVPWDVSSHLSLAWAHHSPSQREILRGYQPVCAQQSTGAEFCVAVGSLCPRRFYCSDTHPAALKSKLAAPLCFLCHLGEHQQPQPLGPQLVAPAVPRLEQGRERLLLHNPPSHTEHRAGSKCMQHFIEKIRMFCT